MKNTFILRTYISAFILLCLAFCSTVTFAGGEGKQTSLWTSVDKANLATADSRADLDKYLAYRLNADALKNLLAEAPLEFTDAARQSEVILEIPTPDGKFARFRLEESPMLSTEIALQFPTWKTFSGQGIDDPTAVARFDFNVNGFHGYVIGATGTYLIDPYSPTDKQNYIVYNKSDANQNRPAFTCNLRGHESEDLDLFSFSTPEVFTNGTQLRTFKIAFSATAQYTNAFGGNTTSAFGGIQTTVNRLITIYRRDLATTFTLVNGTNTVFTNANTGGFLGNEENDIPRNQVVLDMIIGNANYDIGHVMSGGPGIGGAAVSPSLCISDAKAQGYTGSPTPASDAFIVDFVAHEIGHQFAMNHTFNNDLDGTCNQRVAGSAYEPASGVTIMGYAGICAPRNLSAHSIEYFGLRSFDQTLTYLQTTIPQQNPGCGTSTATGNTAPTVTAGQSYNIPKQTPFTLTASATDPNGDALTYLWEEFDLGAPTRSGGANDTDEDGTARPIFRPYNPTTSPSRTFPNLYYILNNANVPPLTYTGTLPFASAIGAIGYACDTGETCTTGERLPSISRTMNFRVTVRDNNANGGGVNDAAATVVVNAGAGPFVITSQNAATTWAGGTPQTITWDVANTTAAPISAANVNILLSTDGGQTFPITLAANTPNDGTQQITVPNSGTTNVRIKVQAAGNIFFDINNTNFTITAAPVRAPFDFDGDGRTDISVFRASESIWYLNGSTSGFSAVRFGAANDLITPADYDGDGKTDVSVFRPSTGVWYRLNSSDNTFFGLQFGQTGDIPLPGDFDGDGKADINVFRPSTGGWYRLNSTNQQPVSNLFGQMGDLPVRGDFNGDGKSDLAVFRPAANQWYVARTTGMPAQNFDVYYFGLSTDILVPADYDGDGKTDIAVFRPSTGGWYRLNSSNNQFVAFQFGINGDIPVVGDYDGDGKADFAVFREGNWYYMNSSNSGFVGFNFGINTDKPIPAAF